MTTFPSTMVLDCSIIIPWYFEDEKTEFTEQMLASVVDQELWVPALWRLEFVNVLLQAERRGRIHATFRDKCIENAIKLPIQVDATSVSIETIYKLSTQYRLTSYDAAYLELAIRRKLPLATLDQALVLAAKQLEIPFITSETS